MIYEHSMLFRLTTPPAEIDQILLDASEVTQQTLLRVTMDKRRERIRDCGTQRVKVITFGFEGDEALMETLRERLWDTHTEIISTLTVPYPQHERSTRYAPRRWDDAVDDMCRPGEDRPVYGQPPEPSPRSPAVNGRFTKEALFDKFDRANKPKRTFTRPVNR